MNQAEFDKQFENRYPYQVSVQDYMEEEIYMLKECGKEFSLDVSTNQAIVIWEYYSEEMDGCWLGVDEDVIKKVLLFLVEEPESFWEYPVR